ncbi:MAG: hypothetical protein RMK29_12005 [Myxococcales bacterium]|nr:hypothetical protein [Myxococcota bacterium]MDW8282433.1 hypothetical protein [Myxococcales bacterium]
MNIPTTNRGIKAGFLATLLLGGCAGPLVQAPFPERPDTVRPGSLRGPFDGQVLDRASGNPISSALVIGCWSYEHSGPLPAPVAARSVSVLTGSDGTYVLPAAPLPPPGQVLARFTLLVYKAGYIGYRSDLRYEDRGIRRDFAQHRNRVLLERFPDGESWARHLVFLGGPAALRRAAQAELMQAAQELAREQPALQPEPDPQPEPPPPPLPEAQKLLRAVDLEARSRGLRFAVLPLADNLSGEPKGPRYDGVHYRALGRPESFDAALRLWRPGSPEDAEALFSRLAQAIQGHELAGPADRTLVAFDGKRRLRGAAALLRERGLVLQVVCGTSLCRRTEDATRLLQEAIGRLAEDSP